MTKSFNLRNTANQALIYLCKKIQRAFIMLVQDPDIWRLCKSINTLWHDRLLQLLKTHCCLLDQICASCWSLERRFIFRPFQIISLLFKTHSLGKLTLKLFSPAGMKHQVPQPREFQEHCNSLGSHLYTPATKSLLCFFFSLGDGTQLGRYVLWSQTHHLT